MKSIDITILIDQVPTATMQQKKFSYRTKSCYEPKNLREARKLYMDLLKNYKPLEPLLGALELNVVFAFETKDKKKKGTYKTTRPDADNQIKLLSDCLTHTGFWQDDSQVARLVVTKKWSDGGAYINIKIKSLEE